MYKPIRHKSNVSLTGLRNVYSKRHPLTAPINGQNRKMDANCNLNGWQRPTAVRWDFQFEKWSLVVVHSIFMYLVGFNEHIPPGALVSLMDMDETKLHWHKYSCCRTLSFLGAMFALLLLTFVRLFQWKGLWGVLFETCMTVKLCLRKTNGRNAKWEREHKVDTVGNCFPHKDGVRQPPLLLEWWVLTPL